MTKLERRVRRKVDGLVVTATSEGLLLREKGRRYEVGPLPWKWLYLQGVKLDVDAKRRAKAVARKAKGAARG